MVDFVKIHPLDKIQKDLEESLELIRAMADWVLYHSPHNQQCNSVKYCGEYCNCGLRDLQKRIKGEE